MPTKHTVVQGEDIGSIAEDLGYHMDTIWDDPANRALRDLRKTPFILNPGDIVTIPDKRARSENGMTGTAQRFVRRGVEGSLQLVLRDTLGKLRDGIAFEVVVDGATPITGTTQSDGLVKVPIVSSAKQATLTIHVGKVPQQYDFVLGGLDPIDTTAGVQGRLNNLGYWSGPIDGVDSPALQEAVADFQGEVELPPTGTVDAATRDKLAARHGS